MSKNTGRNDSAAKSANSPRQEAIARAKQAWPGHHGSSIGIARAPERAQEAQNRAMFQEFIRGTRDSR